MVSNVCYFLLVVDFVYSGNLATNCCGFGENKKNLVASFVACRVGLSAVSCKNKLLRQEIIRNKDYLGGSLGLRKREKRTVARYLSVERLSTPPPDKLQMSLGRLRLVSEQRFVACTNRRVSVT